MRFPSLRGLIPGRQGGRPERFRPHVPRKRPSVCRLSVEQLEERALLSGFEYTLIADNSPSGLFSTLTIVPTINNEGTVALRSAALRGGGSGHFTGNGGTLTPIVTTGDVFESTIGTPNINTGGTVAFYATPTGGSLSLYTSSGGTPTLIADTSGPFSNLTGNGINDAGTVVFRATLRDGGQAILTANGKVLTTLYQTDSTFSGFSEGLGVFINNKGTVVFRAELSGGGEAIVTGNGGPLTVIADTSGPFSSFFTDAPAPIVGYSINDAGDVAFLANLKGGGQAILKSSGGVLTTVADTSGPYSALNRVSINNNGTVAFRATLRAGGAGIFTGPDPVADKIFAIGDPLFGSTVRAFLVPASRGLNDAGQLAFGAQLADLTQTIVRADPKLPPPVTIESVTVNDGAAQRSRVTSLTVAFSGPVTLEPGAFELRRPNGSLVGLSVSASLVDGRTVAVLTFSGSDIIAGSLADGNYTLTIRGDLVRDAISRRLDGDGDGSQGGDHAEALFRLYGDRDGDRDVDTLDLDRLLLAYGTKTGDPGYLDYLDFNGNGAINLIDLFALFGRLGTHLSL